LIVEDLEWNENNQESEIIGKNEGKKSQILINKYERNRYNRALCLSYHGFQCHGCGEILKEKYGPIGENTIDVHHIVPVSKMGGSYQINPVKDLVPLCPNCHRIIHKLDPPLTINALKEIINSSNNLN
jgi:5-methylcytosine-specific restriction protein A